MVTLLTPSSIWGQLASLCFLMSAMFGDLLVIRICLFLAYTWILTNCCAGAPLWPHVDHPGYIALDGIIWACLNLFFHGWALGQLLWDERRITFHSEEEEQVWRFFMRRSGMHRLEMHTSLKRSRRVQFKAGDVVMDAQAAHTQMLLLVDGMCSFVFKDTQGNVLKDERILYSGQTFDIGMFNAFGVYLGFEKQAGHHVTVTARSDCVVYFWSLDDLNYLATRCAPACSSFWRNFALCQVGLEWHLRDYPDRQPVNGRGKPEPAGFREGKVRSSDFTDPLEEYEDQRWSLKRAALWLPGQFAPILPAGMRHVSMPSSGALARNRLMVLGCADRSADSLLHAEPTQSQDNVRLILKDLATEGVLDPIQEDRSSTGVVASLCRRLTSNKSLAAAAEAGGRATSAKALEV